MKAPALAYEDWIPAVFDHRETPDGPWYWSDDARRLPINAMMTAGHFLRLCSDPLKWLNRFSDLQIAHGLELLTNPMVGDHAHFLQTGDVPQQLRVDCILSMATLFRAVFAARCLPALSHLDEAPGSELNRVCYMWWDVLPLYGQAGGHRPNPIDDACLTVMQQTLNLSSAACQESALHGLGHWAPAYPAFTRRTIEAYLSGSTELRPELKAYALAARSGCIQ